MHFCNKKEATVTTKDSHFSELLEVMTQLRHPQTGCPWDRAQTHESLKQYAVEEAYELVDAINSGNTNHIMEEAGDLLFQVVFHACVGEENGTFTMDDIITAICEKMRHRHPHIFNPGVSAPDWDTLKRADRQQESIASELRHMTGTLPSLSRAVKVKKKTLKAGFASELSIDPKDKELCLGAQLFALADACAQEKIDPELALHRYLNAYIQKFEVFENTKEDSTHAIG